MLDHIGKYVELDPYQYGFIKNSNTMSATCDLVNYIATNLDEKNIVVAVFIDLKKASDVVKSEILLRKVEKLGFRNNFKELLKSYLTDRKQFVFINNTCGEILPINYGVPQGSVLGPLLYSLYVLNLKKTNLQTRYFTFADDTVLVYTNKNVNNLVDHINTDINKYFRWLIDNRLKLNLQKTNYIVFKQKNVKMETIRIQIGSEVINEVTNTKYLGLILDNTLNWKMHLEHIKTKIIPMIGQLYRCRNYLSNDVKHLIYNAYFLSIFRYLIVIWGSCGIKTFEEAQTLQNKVIKILFSFDYRTHTNSVYEQTRISKLGELLELERNKTIHAILNGKLKTNIQLTNVRNIHQYNIRNVNNIYLENVRTTIALKNPICKAIQSYNALPEHIQNETNKNRFSKLVKNHIKKDV